MVIRRILAKLVRYLVSYEAPKRDIVKEFIANGGTIGKDCHVPPGTVLDSSHAWHIFIGNNVTFAPGVHIIAHDASLKHHLDMARIGKVIIKDKTFIGARTIILPGVTIGENSIIGAGSIVNKSIPPNVVAAGNPAKVIMSLEKYLKKHKEALKTHHYFEKKYKLENNPTPEMKKEMNDIMGDNFAYIH